jgi:hypothetical protein
MNMLFSGSLELQTGSLDFATQSVFEKCRSAAVVLDQPQPERDCVVLDQPQRF